MRFSLYINPQTPGPEEDHRIIEEITRSARLADEAGFAGICLTEHHFSDYNTYSDSLMYGAYLAGQMKQAWIIMTVVVAPLHNPLTMVSRINLLDHLANGKLIVAMGSGGSPLEFEGLGRNADEKHKLIGEILEVADRAWKHKPGDAAIEFRTTHDKGLMRGRIMPGSYTEPRPHIAKAGLNETAWRAAGLAAQPLVFGRVSPEGAGNVLRTYRSALEEAGHDQATIDFCNDWSVMTKTIMLAETDEDAMEALDAPLATLQKMSAAAFTPEQRAKVTGIAGDDPASFKKAFIEGATIVGSPDTMIKRIREYEEAGVRHMGLHMDYGFMDSAKSRQTFDLFVNEVMPHFAEQRAEQQADLVS